MEVPHLLIDLLSRFGPAALAVAAAVAAIIALRTLKSAHWVVIAAVVWGAVYIVAMPHGLDAARIVWNQDTTQHKLDCGKIVLRLDYVQGDKVADSAPECLK